jgi:hypothetical protein
MRLVESSSRFSSLIGHDLFGKPLHTFPDHALTRSRCFASGGGLQQPKARANDLFRFLVAFELVFEPQTRPLIGVHGLEICPPKATIRRALWHEQGVIRTTSLRSGIGRRCRGSAGGIRPRFKCRALRTGRYRQCTCDHPEARDPSRRISEIVVHHARSNRNTCMKTTLPISGPRPSRRLLTQAPQESVNSPPSTRIARGGEGSGVGGLSAGTAASVIAALPPPPTPPRRFAGGGEKMTLILIRMKG